jgi:ATP-dependent Zn proteases
VGGGESREVGGVKLNWSSSWISSKIRIGGSSVGARHPKGVLLHGQPGSGKTLLARAVAGEASVPFFSVSGSEFMEMLVGMGAAKVRELFGKAKSAGKAIIFIDEIDAIGKRRGGGHTGGHQEQEQTLNQILTEMDGFDNSSTIVVIASTNRPDVLDPALLRSGRFDRKILVARPTLNERKEILGYYVSKKKLAKSVDIASIARRTSGLVGADLENVVNEAALKTARENRKELTVEDFEYALEKVLMGPEKKNQNLDGKREIIIAFSRVWGTRSRATKTEFSDPGREIFHRVARAGAGRDPDDAGRRTPF